ncbi:hypothetical protein HY631_01475 [Candidatus Uhrbacteria bacterium]|nr:hypothetical protein [Candidatus Uhrbacteria bacterium]
MVLTKEARRLAGVGREVWEAIEEGTLPVELLERFMEDPFRMLTPGEVFETQWGNLLPKSLDLTTVCVMNKRGEDVCAGLTKDGHVWTGLNPWEQKADRVVGGAFSCVDGVPLVTTNEGQVFDTDGYALERTILSRDPFIWHLDQSILSEGYDYPWSRRFSDPIGAVLTGNTLCVWSGSGLIRCLDARPHVTTDWEELSIPWWEPDCRVQAAVHGYTAEDFGHVIIAVVISRGEGRWLIVNNDQELQAASISAPVITWNGSVFARVDGKLLKLPLHASAWEDLGEVSGDPVLTGNGSVRTRCGDRTLVVLPDSSQLSFKLPTTPVKEIGSFLICKDTTTNLQILEYDDLGDTRVRWQHVLATHINDFLLMQDGFRASVSLMGGGQLLVVGRREENGSFTWSEIEGAAGCVFDLRQVVTHGKHVYAVASGFDHPRCWGVFTSDPTSSSLGKGSHAIYRLRLEGSLLRWYARTGRMITECRSYLG